VDASASHRLTHEPSDVVDDLSLVPVTIKKGIICRNDSRVRARHAKRRRAKAEPLELSIGIHQDAHFELGRGVRSGGGNFDVKDADLHDVAS
jgi:hypothetical protein